MAIGDNGDQHLEELRRVLPLADLSVGQLWLRYFAIGGSVGQFEIEAYLFAAHQLPVLECDLLVQALNERFMDLSLDIRIPYSSATKPSTIEDPGDLEK